MPGNVVGRDEIAAARARLAGRVRRTPVLRLPAEALGLAASVGEVALKLELLQVTGSFKPRGAFNRVLSAAPHAAGPGVIAASGGNHGAAVAHAARALGLRAEVFVPTISAPAKVARIRAEGAALVQIGATYAEALAASEARAAETGALVVHAYDQPEVIAGQGTVGAEVEEDAPDLTHLLVAVGGGGLIGGIAAWYAGIGCEVVSVEPAACPTFHAALAAGRPVEAPVGGIAADSLGPRSVGALVFAVASPVVRTAVLVGDAAIREAQRRLWSACRLVAEPGGACALAALTGGAWTPPPGARVGVLVCGANTDPAGVADA